MCYTYIKISLTCNHKVLLGKAVSIYHGTANNHLQSKTILKEQMKLMVSSVVTKIDWVLINYRCFHS